ncbi:MAG TPA: lysophospholipid acyltransferase family protein [Chitinophagaceae bacterium]
MHARALMYYLLYGFLYALSLLPMPVLYVLSDGIYVLLYYVFGYRRKVVMQNLLIAFPEKSEPERKKISKKFYRNFLDTFVEIIKLLSASEAFLKKRIDGNWEMVNDVYNRTSKAAQVHLGHTFNWEWANYAGAKGLLYRFLVIYMPIKNMAVDKIFYRMRTRGGSGLIPASPPRAYISGLAKYKKEKYMLVLAADQSPADPSKAYWLNFFGRPTAFVTGPEKGARLNDLPVFFCDIKKTKRGHYKVVFSYIEEHPASTPEGYLTVEFARYLENNIRQDPDMWLWSHRRWKREWKEEYKDLWIDKNKPA